MAKMQPARSTQDLARDDSAGEAVRTYLARHVLRLLAAEPGVREGNDEAVHDARVATRRLRTALGTFRPVLIRDETDPLRSQLRDLGHLLGEARDPFVELRALRRAIADEPDELVLGGVARRIEEDRSAARTVALGRLKAHLDDERTAALFGALRALVDLPLTGPRADDDAAVLLRRVRRTWRGLDRALDDVVDVDDAGTRGARRDETLHAARKAARRARYAAEVVESAVGAPARRSVRRARDLQDVFGQQHDTVVRRATLRRMAVEAYLDGENAFTYGRLHAREESAGEAAIGAAARAVSRARASAPRRWLGP
jgi:CHAD domain-containing protein